MHMDTGHLYGPEDVEQLELERARERVRVTMLEPDEHEAVKSLPRSQRPAALIDFRKNKYRNRPCLCGSGKKFKKCCVNEDPELLNSMLENLKGASHE